MKILDIRRADYSNKKMSQNMIQRKRVKDSMEDVRIVEDGVTNALTAVTTKSSRTDKK